MRIGLGIDVSHGHRTDPVPGPRTVADTIDAMLAEATVAERAGFHSIRCPDRHGRPEIFLPGALQLLTLIARETHRVALGAYVLPNTLYNPMLLAEQCAVIDTLSRGRLFMGLARGKDYWDYFGIPTERRLGRFLENLRVLELANRGEPFSFHGDFYDIPHAHLTPVPYQRPRYPIWGGGAATAAIERCADYAEAWGCNDAPIDLATWDARVDAYRAAARARGKEPFVVLMRNAWVADSYDAAVEEFGRSYIEHLQFVARRGSLAHIPSLDHPDKITPETIREHAVMGSAADCIETIERYREQLGVDYVTLRFRFPEGPSLAATQRQIQRFGDEVVGPIHRKYPAPADHPAIPAGARW